MQARAKSKTSTQKILDTYITAKILTLCCVVFNLLTAICSAPARAQYTTQNTTHENLFSPSVAQKFYETACEMAQHPYPAYLNEGKNLQTDIQDSTLEQAIIFLSATMELDRGADYVGPDMIKLACRHLQRDYSEPLHQLLFKYVDNNADLEITDKAIQYLLDKLNSREDREKLLEDLLKNLGGKSALLDSELAGLLGFLKAEKADNQSAASYLIQAYHNNKHNKLAFAKLTELAPEQIGPAMLLEHQRLALVENPFDMDAALAYAQYLEQLQLYEYATDAYQYCSDLFEFLYPSQQLPAEFYLYQAISDYNTRRNQHKCLKIAEQFRQSGRFNLMLEAVAGKTAEKLGDSKKAMLIFKNAEEKMLADYQSETQTHKHQIASELGWFFCFVLPDADNALDWANKAYSAEPNSVTTASILAYALVMNDQTDWAGMIIENYEKNPIAELALAQIQLKKEQKDSAIQTLKSVITSNPASLEAEYARKLLAQLGAEYIPPFDPAIILATLRDSFGQAIVPTFARPEEIFSVQLNLRGTKFSYDSSFGGSVIITNNSSQPLIISDNGLFTGHFRIDAALTGDINKKIPNLISQRIRPASPVKPGDSLIIPLRLLTGELRETLLAHPQASLDIEFTLYTDPAKTPQGELINQLSSIKPYKVAIKRPGIEINNKYLQNRFDALTKGRQGQKIITVHLFAGLLAEQMAMAGREPLYKFMYADWMPDLIKSALLHNLTDDDWVVRVHTMVAMLALPLDYEMINAVAENLNVPDWPCRLIALFILAKSQGGSFNKVLDWTAQYDQNTFVRGMAMALGGEVPQTPEQQNQAAVNSKPQI